LVFLFQVRLADLDALQESIAMGEPRRATLTAAFEAYQHALATTRDQMSSELEEAAGHVRAMTTAERRDQANMPAMLEAAESIVPVIDRAEGRAKDALAALTSAVLLDASYAEVQSWVQKCRRLRREQLLNSKSGSPDESRDLDRHVDLISLVAREKSEVGCLAPALRAARDTGPEAPEALRMLPDRIGDATDAYEQALDEVLVADCWQRASNSARLRIARMRDEATKSNSVVKREVQRWERIDRCASEAREAIAAALGEIGAIDAARAWRSAYDATLFPQLSAPKKVDLACRWIRSHPLSPESAREVDRAYVSYQEALAPRLEQMKRAMVLAVTRDGVPPAVVGFRRRLGQFAPVEQQLRAARALSQATMELFAAALDEGLAKELRLAERQGFGHSGADIPLEY
jgi:hypothetical protein